MFRPILQPLRRSPLPLPSPRQPLRRNPLPLPSPRQPLPFAVPTATPAPEPGRQPLRRNPLPLPSPRQPLRRNPLPLPSPRQPLRRNPLPLPSPRQPLRRNPLPLFLYRPHGNPCAGTHFLYRPHGNPCAGTHFLYCSYAAPEPAPFTVPTAAPEPAAPDPLVPTPTPPGTHSTCCPYGNACAGGRQWTWNPTDPHARTHACATGVANRSTCRSTYGYGASTLSRRARRRQSVGDNPMAGESTKWLSGQRRQVAHRPLAS